MNKKTLSKLQKLIDVNIPIIYIDDFDYARVDEMLALAFPKNAKIKEWNPASTYTRFKSKEPLGECVIPLTDFLRETVYRAEHEDSKDDYIILREINEFIADPEVLSLLTHISQRKLYDRNYETTIIISGPDIVFPPVLNPYISILSIDAPDDKEINRLINEHLEVNGNDPKKFSDADRASLMPSLRGLSLFEIDRVLDMALSVNGSLGEEDKEMILEQKKAQVKKSGLIDLVNVKETLNDIGGMENLKKYLQKKSLVMSHLVEAHENKIATPKGVFIVGMPGCGKSLCAKAAAAQFNAPLLKLDMGSMMGKYVGQSEGNLRKAIHIAEAAAPCVLWIDEIEKGFSGVGGDNDIMTRMFGYFLSWMQDKTSSVYVIATANNADNLPPELKRKGRFDEIFCVNLPNEAERKAIFEVHLKKRCQLENISNLAGIVRETQGFNGADIEAVVNEAMEECFIDLLKKMNKNVGNSTKTNDKETAESVESDQKDSIKVKLTHTKLCEVAKRTISISKSCEKQIKKMEEVFKESNFTNASR